MKKYSSAFLTVVLLFCNKMIASYAPVPYQNPIRICMIILGGLSLVILLSKIEEAIGNQISTNSRSENILAKIEEINKNVIQMINESKRSSDELKEQISTNNSRSENILAKLEEINKNAIQMINESKQSSDELKEQISNIDDQAVELKQSINKSLDEISEELVDMFDKTAENISNVSYKTYVKIGKDWSKSCREITKQIGEMSDDLDEMIDKINHNQEIYDENMSKMIEEIDSFKNMNDAYIEKLTEMNKEDFAILKGYFDDGKPNE